MPAASCSAAASASLGHRHGELSVSPARRHDLARSLGHRPARMREARLPRPHERGMQLLRGLPGSRRLSGVSLSRPQIGHRIDERDQVPGQRTRLADAVARLPSSRAAAPRSATHPPRACGAEPAGAAPGPPGHTHRPRTAAPGCRSPAPRRAARPPPPTPRPRRNPDHRRRTGAGAPPRRRPAAPRAGRSRRVPGQ